MNDYNELNKIKINLERELDRLSNAIEKIKNYGELVSAFGYNLEDIKNGILK